jgi:hypothetical protein
VVGEASRLTVEFAHFRELRPPARPRELSLLGVERSFRGPKGQESLSQGFCFLPDAPKGAPADEAPRNRVWKCRCPFKALMLECVSQG